MTGAQQSSRSFTVALHRGYGGLYRALAVQKLAAIAVDGLLFPSQRDTVFDTCMQQAPSMRHLPDWEAVGVLYEEVCSEHTLRFSDFLQQLMNRNMSEGTAWCSGKEKIVCSQCYIPAFFWWVPLEGKSPFCSRW